MMSGDETKIARNKGGRPVNQEARNFNIAIYRLVRGECDELGGVVAQLSAITGLTENAIRCRVNEVHFQYPPEELEPDPSALTFDELHYLGKRYKPSSDPGVAEWLESIGTTQRRNPNYEEPSRKRPRPSFSKN